MNITATIIKALAPSLSTARAQVIADSVNESAPLYQVNTPQRMAAILSQIAHESGGFTANNESLNYTDSRLIALFSYYRKNPQLAKAQGRTPQHPANQQLIANTVYADANRPANSKLGNDQPNDGWYFRGAGPMQLTGRDVFTAYAKYKKTVITEVVDQLRTSDTWGMDSAFWFFAIYKKLLDEADRGDIVAISKAVNGGTTGLDERMKLYEQAKKALGIK